MADTRQPSSGPDRQRPILTPPGGKKTGKKDSRITVLLVTVGLLVLLGMAAMVIWLLPHSKSQTNISTSQSISPTTASTNKPAANKTDQGHARAELLLGEWLKLQARAEAENIAVWGADRYPAIVAEATRGDRQYQEQQYIEAQGAYQKSISGLSDLLASREERLATALANGEQALADHDGPGAGENFDLALIIDPHNEQAHQGAERAANLAQVLALYREGLDLEHQGSLEDARLVLLQAVEIDSQFSPARDALVRVAGQIEELAFQKVMSQTLAALNKNDTAAARKSLAEAAKLRPSDASVQDVGQRLAAMEKAQQLAELQDKVERLTAEERWAEILQVYDKALAIDPHLGFAESGRKIARLRFELDRQVQEIISRPDRLQESGPRQEAEMTLARLKNIEDPGTRLQAQIIDLSRLIRTASEPAEVILLSDNETSVAIYRVGKFGQFFEKKVSLLPGAYTVVGSRPGFRDVRLTLTVQAGNNPISIDIRCEEPI